MAQKSQDRDQPQRASSVPPNQEDEREMADDDEEFEDDDLDSEDEVGDDEDVDEA